MENITHEWRPIKGYKPIHHFVKQWLFQYENIQDEVIAMKEANLADAIARVAHGNGLSVNDVHKIFPLVLRMLKSNSEWTK